MKTEDQQVFYENANTTPVYCSGIAGVLVDNGNIHIAFYQEQISRDGSKERTIVLRLILPVKGLLKGREMVDFEIAAAMHSHPGGDGVGTAMGAAKK